MATQPEVCDRLSDHRAAVATGEITSVPWGLFTNMKALTRVYNPVYLSNTRDIHPVPVQCVHNTDATPAGYNRDLLLSLNFRTWYNTFIVAMKSSILLMWALRGLSVADGVPALVGNWSTYTQSLPNSQLPHVPMVGNGQIGVLLDSWGAASSETSESTAVHQNNTLYIWIGSNSMWSCGACGDPNSVVPGCCRQVTIGGVSISLEPTFAASTPLAFAAQQRIGLAQLWTSWVTASGSVFETLTYMHPLLNAIVTNLTWSPAGTDPAELVANVSTWAVAAGGGHGARPATVGCLDPTTVQPAPCSSQPIDGQYQFSYVSRQATSDNTSVMQVWAGLSTIVLGAQVNAIAISSEAPGQDWAVTATISIGAGSTASIITAEAETRTPYSSTADPALTAAALLSTFAASSIASDIAASASSWWSSFWNLSSISLPSRPGAEELWFGAQYALASTAPSDASTPAPGLYGVWATSDDCSWNGDFTLDYNYESTFYGVFSSNHADQAEGYWGPIIDWMQPAQQHAQQQAKAANITCPSNAMHYACHLVPWGLQSDDQSVYMHWNGNFAALLMINHWEYTLNASFAATVTYPLLDGLNAWWACYLNRTTFNATSGAYYYGDDRVLNPDEQHEGQPVPNPQIALALVSRTMWAQASICNALGLAVPSYVDDILTNLYPFNTNLFSWTNSSGSNFTIWNDTRCHNDSGFIPGDTLGACMASCASMAACDIFSFCPSSAVAGCQDGPSCWQFAAAENGTCTYGAGFTSGRKIGGPAPQNLSVWTAYGSTEDGSATVGESDEFSLYPLWPSEHTVSIGALNATIQSLAQATTRAYVTWLDRPVDIFPQAVLAGYQDPAATMARRTARPELAPRIDDIAIDFPRDTGDSSPQPPLPGYAYSPTDVLNGLQTHMNNFFGPNLLVYAPGGGVENIGLSRFINDMLLGSVGGIGPGAYIQLFAFWPADEPASFQNLLAKGGFLVSAAYNDTTRTVESPVSVTAQYTLLDAATPTCTMADPWGNGPGSFVITCNGSTMPATWLDGYRFSFQAPRRVQCLLSKQ